MAVLLHYLPITGTVRIDLYKLRYSDSLYGLVLAQHRKSPVDTVCKGFQYFCFIYLRLKSTHPDATGQSQSC